VSVTLVVTSPVGAGRFLVRDPWAGGSTFEVAASWIDKYVMGSCVPMIPNLIAFRRARAD